MQNKQSETFAFPHFYYFEIKIFVCSWALLNADVWETIYA